MSITFERLTGTAAFASGSTTIAVRAWGYLDGGTRGTARLRLRARGSASNSILVGTPQPPVSCIHNLRVNVGGTSIQRDRAEGIHFLSLRSRGFGGHPGSVSGRSWMHLRAFGQPGTGQTAYAMLTALAPEVSGYGDQWFGVIGEEFRFDVNTERLYTAVTRTPLKIGTNRRSRYEGTGAAHEQFQFAGSPAWVVHMLTAEGITFGTLVEGGYSLLARAVSRVLLSGQAANFAEALQLIADALAFKDVVERLQLADTVDALQLGDQIDAFYAAFARAVDRMVLGADAVPEFTITVMLRDGFSLGVQATHEAELFAQLSDAVGFAMSLSFDDGEFIAWVLNTESQGLSRYTNYPFNSFAKIGGKYYGAHTNGIARLGGPDDMGEPIKARLRLGMFDFGDRHLKSFSEAFVGMSATGQMLLKAIFVDERSGEKNMAVYKIKPRPAGASRETAASLGKGFKAVDWDFVLENVDGADFDLQTIQFFPTQLSRRTRG